MTERRFCLSSAGMKIVILARRSVDVPEAAIIAASEMAKAVLAVVRHLV
jgi:hypothetical protein